MRNFIYIYIKYNNYGNSTHLHTYTNINIQKNVPSPSNKSVTANLILPNYCNLIKQLIITY